MSGQPAKGKQSSRWGSLLQGAVAGIESRLDTILAEDAALASRSPRAPEGPKANTTSRPELGGALQEKARTNLSRSSSRSQRADRPSNRSAKLLADPESLQRPSSRLSDISAVRANTPDQLDADSLHNLGSYTSDPSHAPETGENGQDYDLTSPEDSHMLSKAESGTRYLSASRSIPDGSASSTAHNPVLSVEETASILAVGTDTETSEAPGPDNGQPVQEEETHALLERIDALQAKLQYLADDAAKSARRSASEAPNGSFAKKLAEKDEQIALLMQEGQALSKTEVSQMTVIKRLRKKILENEKLSAEIKRLLKDRERVLLKTNVDLKQAEVGQRAANDKLARLLRVEREADALKTERDAKHSTIISLQRQLEEATTKADDTTLQIKDKSLISERKLVEELREEVSSLKADKKQGDERAKTDLRNAQQELRHEQERAQLSDTGLRNELSLMESRHEFLRARTEEASSGLGGDAHAKLIRQIETLQTQYAVASENWQGIEGSLQSRLTELEKERTEAQRQETESRRKFRDANNKSRQLHDKIEELSRQCQNLEQTVAEQAVQVEKSHSRISELEKLLRVERERLDKERKSWSTTLLTRIEEEKLKWRQEASNSLGARANSPIGYSRKASGLDNAAMAARKSSRNASTELHVPMLDRAERSTSRRSSNLVRPFVDSTIQNGFDSDRTTPSDGINRDNSPTPGNILDTPSIQTMEREDPFENHSSPHRTVNDMISGSVVAAGPSVQLVERMSAAVRRLESEKAASRDEMARLSMQRDEARQEVVSLMREIEEKRAVDVKLAKLDKELVEVTQRYQTTLELLGEKSEMVEELQADVADLKKIYRDLIDSSLK